MLFFLSIAAKKGYIVDTYTDCAIGNLAKNDQGKYAMTQVRLRPQVSFSGDKLPTTAQSKEIHEQAHEQCFIANSVTTEVIVEPQG
jgi:organic hydroperoxide reductase OsmC/OhrA